MLVLPCTREQKYAGKQAIDSFFVRMGDRRYSYFSERPIFALSASGFAKFNIALVVVWLMLAVMIGREYRRVMASGSTSCLRKNGDKVKTG